MQTLEIDKGWLRKTFGSLLQTPAQPSSEPVRTIMMVGAIAMYGQILPDDEDYLKTALKNLATLRVPVSPDFEVDPVNFREGGPDFLAPEFNRQADLLLVCNIVRDCSKLRTSLIKAYDLYEKQISPHDNGVDAWHNAALRTKARFVMPFTQTMGLSMEIEATDFHQPEFQQMILPGLASPVVMRVAPQI